MAGWQQIVLKVKALRSIRTTGNDHGILITGCSDTVQQVALNKNIRQSRIAVIPINELLTMLFETST